MQSLIVGKLRVEIYPDRAAAARAAAEAAVQTILMSVGKTALTGIVFATGASQLAMLAQLTQLPDIPWQKINGFHLDEYVGIPRDHRASFRRYLEENLCRRVSIGSFHEIDGSSSDPERVCRDYAELLQRCLPALCLLGIGENGHLAFNEPAEADFYDTVDVKVVELDAVCRQQQVAEGWFDSIDQVPQRAITLTISAILRIPRLIVSVPGQRKASIMRRTLSAPISTACPATILRTHPNATLYLDEDAAAELDSFRI